MALESVLFEPRWNMGCSLIGPALWKGREGGKLERDEADTGGRRRKGEGMTGLLSARLCVHMSKLLCVHLSIQRNT